MSLKFPTARLLALAALLAPLFSQGAEAPVASPASPASGALTLERVFAEPPLAGRPTLQAQMSPDGAWVSYLRPAEDNANQLELWAQPAAGGAPRRLVGVADVLAGRSEQLTEAERMALERRRIRQSGITSYQWCGPSGRTLLFPLSGDLYLVRLTEQGPRAQRLTFDDQEPEQDPTCSPDGQRFAYVKQGRVWVQGLDASDPARAVSPEAPEHGFWGLAEFIAAEELDRKDGYWWSPDGRQLLALRVDEARVPLKTRARIQADGTTLTQQRYPAPGDANAAVTAWVLDAARGAAAAPVQLPLPANGEYVARAGWFGDGAPWLQTLTRDQTRLTLTEYDTARVADGAARGRTVIDERDPAWVETHDDLMEIDGVMMSGRPALLWSSEASGRRQLVLVDRKTGARRVLTQEPEPVAHRICASGDTLVYAAARDRGRTRELFAINLVNGATRALDGAAARQWRDARGDAACARLLVTRSAWGEPPRLSLQPVNVAKASKSGEGRVALPADAPDPLLATITPVPQVVDITAADGKTPLNAFFFAPLDGREGPHPVIVMAYGGPGIATLNWGWSRDTALIAYWQRRGYGVFTYDGRGMVNRDRDFTRAHYRAFGVVDVADLFATVRQLPQRVKGVDAARIGFVGASYGGFLGARAVLDKESPIAASVAASLPTDWRLYDTAYTERYLGLPRDESGAQTAPYRQSSLVERADQLSRPLLLVHGTADDNVLFEHTLLLTEALQRRALPFEMMIYPGQAHGISAMRLHLYKTIDAFFARQLAPGR